MALPDGPRGPDTAVIHHDLVWDYGALRTRVAARVAALERAGLRPGQVVTAPAAPALDLLVMQHALARLHCGLLPLDASHDRGAVAALERRVSAEWRWRPPAGDRDGVLEPTGIPGPEAESSDTRVALVVETSGSDGRPKAAMLTPENLLASAGLVNGRLGVGAGDCWLCCLPLQHVAGLMIGYRCGLVGAALVLHEGFDAAAVARDLVRCRVTHLSVVPPMLARLLDVTDGPPPALRVLLVGGQALSPVLAERTLAAGWPLHLTYGMTETASQIATSGRLLANPPEGQVGPVLPGISVRCDGTAEAPGRIRVRGPVVMAGYANPWRSPGDGLEDGWLPTADVGYLAPGGDLVVVGRANDVLVIGGESVLPARVEARVARAPGVTAVAVAALPDPVWGHRLAVAYTGDVRPETLDAWCRVHLPGRERPRGFRRLTALPLLANGKLDRGAVRSLLAEAREPLQG